MDSNERKAIVGMSGGVDSSVAAFLIKEAGYEVTGATMRLYDNDSIGSDSRTCCSLDSINDACAVANRIGISYVIYDMRAEFRREVIDSFVSEYEKGRTPNPCFICNNILKFDSLYRAAFRDLSDDEKSELFVATGHYAVIEHDPSSGRWMLRKGADHAKDQSYFLSGLTQEQLSRTLFPLGSLTKAEVREIASSLGLATAKKRDSQDICFVPGGDYADFIRRYTGRTYPAGEFTDSEGNVLGLHKGIINYTIGQRKGLGLSLKKPAYVLELDTARNRVILGDNNDLFKRTLTASSFNWISIPEPSGDIRASVRIRYRHRESPARIIPIDEGRVMIEFDEPQRAVTGGQTAAVYDGEYVIGGGVID